jgi:hypothetical protein
MKTCVFSCTDLTKYLLERENSFEQKVQRNMKHNFHVKYVSSMCLMGKYKGCYVYTLELSDYVINNGLQNTIIAKKSNKMKSYIDFGLH